MLVRGGFACEYTTSCIDSGVSESNECKFSLIPAISLIFFFCVKVLRNLVFITYQSKTHIINAMENFSDMGHFILEILNASAYFWFVDKAITGEKKKR